VHEELQAYDQLIARFQEVPPSDWESMVSSHRDLLRLEFFAHVNSRLQALQVGPPVPTTLAVIQTPFQGHGLACAQAAPREGLQKLKFRV